MKISHGFMDVYVRLPFEGWKVRGDRLIHGEVPYYFIMEEDQKEANGLNYFLNYMVIHVILL